MATIKTSDIKDRNSFKSWLDARPEANRRQEAVLLASRASLRVLPFMHRRGKFTDKRYATLLSRLFWYSAISRVAATYPTREITAAASASFAAYAYASAYAAAASASATYASAYAAVRKKYRDQIKAVTFEYLDAVLPPACIPSATLIERARELMAI